MTPQELKASILQLAIQGKLVEQNAADGNIDETLDVINKKRKQLVKNGQLKKLGKINKTSDVVLEIPDSWRFVCLSEIISKRIDNRGKTPPHSLIRTDECCIDLLEINSIIPGGSIKHENVEKFIDEKTYATLRGYIEKDDILIATVGSVGKFAMMDDSKSAIAQNIIAIKCFEEIEQKYIFYLLQTPYFYASMGNITMEAVQASIKVPDLMNLRVPLPPLAEQKRIVAKIEELLPLIDCYEQAWSKLEDFNQRFPVDMQKSILQMAIQGKLVPQLPEEGTGEELFQQIQAEKQRSIKAGTIQKEKPLPEITDDEIPFDIPENWVWVRLRQICTKIVDGDHNPPAGVKYRTEFLMLSAQNINQNQLVHLDKVRYLTEDVFRKENERTKAEKGDILLTTVGTLGRSCIYEGNYNISFQRSVSVISTLIFNHYLKFVFDSPFIQQHMVRNATGTAQKGFYLNQVENLIIPLPPLAEQKRIVAKLEEILLLCERLK